MPVWHEATRRWVAEGKLVVVGVTEEQHPDRCRLFLQWHGIDWPMMHDPITKLGLTAVPVVTAIDEYGIVRLTRPDPATIEQEFLNREFPPPEGGAHSPAAGQGGGPPAPKNAQVPTLEALQRRTTALREQAAKERSARAWREVGDAELLWGGPEGVVAAITAYGRAVDADPGEGSSQFRLGVAYRMRYDSPARQGSDFQAAVDAWGRALSLDPNQYIWRRRIEQYGPRLEKPYPFYDWIAEARAAIRARGETPVSLTAEPTGAEIAAPLRSLAPAPEVAEPDSGGRIIRDPGELIRVETAVVPRLPRPGSPVRLHLVFRPNAARDGHWNNESQPLRVWLEPPAGLEIEQRLIELPQPSTATSLETREASLELRVPASASPGPVELTGYALYNVCEGATGTCLFRRQDLRVRVEVQAGGG